MTAPSSIDPARFLSEHLAPASPDLLRSTLITFINTLMSAAADALCGAGNGRSFMAVTPKSSWPWGRALLHSVYDRPDMASSTSSGFTAFAVPQAPS